VDFNLSRHMKWKNSGGIQSCIKMDEGWTFTSTNGLLRFDIQDPGSDGWEVNLGGIKVNENPRYVGNDDVEYDLVGFGRINKGIPTYTTDSVVKSMDFDSGSQTLVLYAIWKPLSCVLKFNPGSGKSGTMADKVVKLGVPHEIDECTFTPPEGEAPLSSYADPSNDDGESVPLWKFSHWTYSFGGRSGVVWNGHQFVVSGLDARTVPVVYFTANWEMKYDAIDFYVDGDLYCTSLVDRKERELKYPLKKPEGVIGWDRVEGDWLPGIQRPMKIVCSSTKGPDEVIEDSD
jgi:hypothetical protein